MMLCFIVKDRPNKNPKELLSHQPVDSINPYPTMWHLTCLSRSWLGFPSDFGVTSPHFVPSLISSQCGSNSSDVGTSMWVIMMLKASGAQAGIRCSKQFFAHALEETCKLICV